MGVLYVCDEPSVGLHAVDNRRMVETLLRLRDLGNTILIVEQNARLSLARSDRGYILANGEVVHTAPASEILDDPHINEYFLGTLHD